MNIREVMIKNVTSCGPDTSLESIALQMWDQDCGSIPVIDNTGRPLGILTDRDIAMGCAMNHKALWEMRATEITNNRPLYTCRSDDDVQTALQTMATQHIRRLPVVDAQGRLEGMLSVDDIVALAKPNGAAKKAQEISYEDAMDVLRSVSKHH